MSANQIVIKKNLTKADEGLYLPFEFNVGEGIERIDIEYSYEKVKQMKQQGVTLTEDHATIDFSITSSDRHYLGSSGSNRSHLFFSSTESSVGFLNDPIKPGKWTVTVGAYKIPEEGIEVTYTILFTPKKRRLFKGDTHVHTNGSDGALSIETIVRQAKELNLDYLFITDHNNFAVNTNYFNSGTLTVIPGMEWTQYNGHAGFLGTVKPFAGNFVSQSIDDTRSKMSEAQNNGALIVLNHPFCPDCPWKWGFDVPFDAIEIWNGVIAERNMKAINWWHEQLCLGKKIPITGGSDFHRPGLLNSLGVPTYCVYALSKDPEDILSAIRHGSGYITYTINAPTLDLWSKACSFGDTVDRHSEITVSVSQLKGGEEIHFITDNGREIKTIPKKCSDAEYSQVCKNSKFFRIEIYGNYIKGLEKKLELISNPIYFRG
ncbi:CehA/McbA family metallohydrolase [Sporolactobacillus shoreicorticis]|uniref:CehA/McbA family metallohydrolase n=1 Tax=Sporolactobacillus shoreicorticis TaxID=1923877 RepID=A0ABW5S300_9BACL|nr:CehA/McbA family metallohydrolase [Sporolactobacillus shoreicorticis]MCO7124245.1 CehA/McbA family metallohydrolase [Sporolactobacillus shoreicorticis]